MSGEKQHEWVNEKTEKGFKLTPNTTCENETPSTSIPQYITHFYALLNSSL